ncbi:MAG: non-canonical purine NTP pyrophosphatase [Candidatus Paracaedibacteraceae bacterium]|nr:non-canonical purine NTP pyrophosphatase [Candidatus Paracaedibacteraceae bacterium]
MKKLIIASTNAGKIAEIIQIIKELNFEQFEVQSISNYNIPEPDEPYDDFLSNATHKAKYYGKALNQLTLSDDSGLCIEALNGFPGIKTKDFMLEFGGYESAYAELERMLMDHQNKKAYFQTAMALYCPIEDKLLSSEDNEWGIISFPARGTNGFGFDPVFIPNGYDKTMAELGPIIKNKISHRAKSLKNLIQRYQLSL